MSTSTLKSTPKSTPESTPESTPDSTPKISSVNPNETDSRDDMSLDSIRYDTDGANDAQEEPKYSPTPTPEGDSSATESKQDRNKNTAQWVAKLREKIADLHQDIDDFESASDSELEVDRLIDVEMYSETSCSEHSDPDLVMRRLSECTGNEESESDEHEEIKEHGDEDEDEDEPHKGQDENEDEDEDEGGQGHEDEDKYEGDDEGEDVGEHEHEHGHGEQEQGDKAKDKECDNNKQSPESFDCDVVMRRSSEFQSNNEEESDEEEQEEGEIKEEVQAKDKGKTKEKHEDKDEKEEGELDEDEEKEDNGEKEKGEENGQLPETFDFNIIMRRWSELQLPQTPGGLNEFQELTTVDYAQDASLSDCSMLSASPTRTAFTFATSYMRSRSPRSRDQTPTHHLSPSLRYRPYERNPPPGDWAGDRCGYITYMFLPTPVLYLARAGGIWSHSRTPPLSSCKNRQVGDIHFTSGEVEGRLYWVCCDMETDSGRGWVPWELGEAHPLCSNLLLNHFPINEPPHWF